MLEKTPEISQIVRILLKLVRAQLELKLEKVSEENVGDYSENLTVPYVKKTKSI
ncbi:MAG: hypothetical protein QXH37_01460 [Candidatus Bathyarchaeia archaeon]